VGNDLPPAATASTAGLSFSRREFMAREMKRNEARQGKTGEKVRWVLLISTVLAVVLLFAILFYFV